MPILAVTLGAEEDEEAAAHSIAPAAMLPIVSEAMKLEVMHLIWANFEVSIEAVRVCRIPVHESKATIAHKRQLVDNVVGHESLCASLCHELSFGPAPASVPVHTSAVCNPVHQGRSCSQRGITRILSRVESAFGKLNTAMLQGCKRFYCSGQADCLHLC